MAFGFKITAQALRDLKSIGDHISKEDFSSAEAFCERLLDHAHSLTTFPYRHGSWSQQPNIRKVPFETYIIFYKIYDEEATVEILRFWHAARNQTRLRLREDRGAVYEHRTTAKQEA